MTWTKIGGQFTDEAADLTNATARGADTPSS